MPGDNETIASSRCKLFMRPGDGGKATLMALVEDFSCTDQLTPEMLQGIGDFVPTDSVVNTMAGAFRWGRVHRLNRTILRTIKPEVARYAEYEEFEILAVDPKDNKPIARLIGCRPQSLDTSVSNGRSVRENYQGLCRYIKRGAEISES